MIDRDKLLKACIQQDIPNVLVHSNSCYVDNPTRKYFVKEDKVLFDSSVFSSETTDGTLLLVELDIWADSTASQQLQELADKLRRQGL